MVCAAYHNFQSAFRKGACEECGLKANILVLFSRDKKYRNILVEDIPIPISQFSINVLFHHKRNIFAIGDIESIHVRNGRGPGCLEGHIDPALRWGSGDSLGPIHVDARPSRLSV